MNSCRLRRYLHLCCLLYIYAILCCIMEPTSHATKQSASLKTWCAQICQEWGGERAKKEAPYGALMLFPPEAKTRCWSSSPKSCRTRPGVSPSLLGSIPMLLPQKQTPQSEWLDMNPNLKGRLFSSFLGRWLLTNSSREHVASHLGRFKALAAFL